MAKPRARKIADHRTRVGAERSARTESRILAAALQVFADLGPDAPKIDDFVLAAGISRGTFYNHFQSVEELLSATSEWTTRETIETIEAALDGIEGPALRYGVGTRLFFAKAKSDPVWCRFVARVWKLGGIELPGRDLEEGLRSGVFRAPSVTAGQDLLFGAIRQALMRIGTEKTSPTYGDEMTELLLQALGTDARKIASVMKHRLPSLPSEDASAQGKVRSR
ncbi:MAG: TetR/AcrR family transcriptional regulator [Polyangiales bacterium]